VNLVSPAADATLARKTYMTALEHKRCIITGAFGTLGAATARALAGAGARVALLDRAPHAPPGLIDACGPGAVEIGAVDLTNSADAAGAFDTVRQRLGTPHALINIAGMFRWQPVSAGGVEIWDALFEGNLKTAVISARAALGHMDRHSGGRIINIGANAALKASVGMGPYTASKSAVHRLTESLAEELKDIGITVNAVLPSIIDTPTNRADMPQADFSKWVTPEALADVIVFLVSDASQAITGALIPVTGRV
jgi:NAD(P)-dependent dehydrogenase (short-subunit alcohol dehydrogenase family)